MSVDCQVGTLFKVKTGQQYFVERLMESGECNNGWSCRMVSGSSIRGNGLAVFMLDGWRRSLCRAVECGGKMSIHDVCTLYAGGCLRSITPQSQLVGIHPSLAVVSYALSSVVLFYFILMWRFIV